MCLCSILYLASSTPSYLIRTYTTPAHSNIYEKWVIMTGAPPRVHDADSAMLPTGETVKGKKEDKETEGDGEEDDEEEEKDGESSSDTDSVAAVYQKHPDRTRIKERIRVRVRMIILGAVVQCSSLNDLSMHAARFCSIVFFLIWNERSYTTRARTHTCMP